MSSDEKIGKDKQVSSEVFDSLKPSDFDGHTSFATMNAEQRLMWLSQAAAFIFEVRGKKSLT